MSTPRNKFIEFTSETWEEVLDDAKAALRAHDEYSSWTDHLPSDLGVVLLEALAYFVDMMRYHQNVTATEFSPATARSRSSLCRQAEWFGYFPHPAAAAQADLKFTKANADNPATIPARTKISTTDNAITFETTRQLYIPPGQETGTIGAVHGTHIESQIIGTSDGSANQQLKLLNRGLVMLTEGEYALEVYVGNTKWERYDALPWAAGADGWRLWIDSDGDAWIRFGDGIYGNIPALGSQIIAYYTVGGGVDGNVGAHTLTSLRSNIANIASVTNEAAASGGADIEDTESLRANMPSQVITRGRAVTRDDYERLAEAFGEIDKVDVKHPSANVVQLYILPQGGVTPSDSLLDSVKEYFTDIRMITEDLQVLAPSVVTVDVGVRLVLTEDAVSTDVVARVTSGLRVLLENSDFNTTVYIQDIYDHLDTYDDIEHATVTQLAEKDDSGINDITTEAGEILASGQVTVEVV